MYDDAQYMMHDAYGDNDGLYMVMMHDGDNGA